MPKTQTLLSIVATVAVAALIGCGGSGGPGVSTGITTSSNGSAGGTNNTGSTGTTGTTGTSANAGTTGAPGTLPPNVIFYSEDVVQGSNAETQVRRVNPDGTNDALYVTLPVEFQGLGLNPNVPDQVLFGYDPDGGGMYGLFRNSSVSPTGAQTIVPPQYVSINSISVTPDGASVIFVASKSLAEPSLLLRVPIGGGTVEMLDAADDATLSPSGNLVAYSKVGREGAGDVFVRDLRLPVSVDPVRITDSATEDVLPNWSRSGARLVLSRLVSDTNYDLFTVDATNGANAVQITATDTDSEFGASFSGDDTQVAFTLLSSDLARNGLYRQEAKSASEPTRFLIKATTTIREDTHWTNSAGRSHRAINSLKLRLKKRKPAISAATK